MSLNTKPKLEIGENDRLIYHGDILTLVKAIRLLNERQIGFPLSSHHGTYLRLVDYHGILRVAEKNGSLLFIYEKLSWSAVISEMGHSSNAQPGITVKEKSGFMKMLENAGYDIITQWNHDNTGTSMSVIVEDTSLSYPNPTFFDDRGIKNQFVEELTSYFEILSKVG